VTDATAKQQINAFVVGVKALGLWSNMVCWPLRSAQNKGSGTTAYSLGGLTTANGTVSSGTGSWTTDGFLFSAGQQIAASVPSQPQDLSLMMVAAGNGSALDNYPNFLAITYSAYYYNNTIEIAGNFNPNEYLPFVRNSDNAGFTGTAITNSLSSSTSFTCLALSAKLGGLFTNKNYRTGASGSVSAPTTGTATLNKIQINGRIDGGIVYLANPIKYSFAALFSPAIFSTMDQVYSLYKSNLGTGLGLP
jgi:hypothetical protein